MRFYIADCHFGHDKVRLLDGRPFASVEEMDEAMIVRWNERVRKKKDEVVILGDLCLGKGEQVNELLHKLNGKKYLVTGNHDRLFLRDKKFDPSLLEWVKPYAELKDNGRKLVLCHYPIICYNGQYHGDSTYMLYGHVHDTPDYKNVLRFQRESTEITYHAKGRGASVGEERHLPCNLINCFAGFSGYYPLTLEEWIDKQNNLCYDVKRCEEKKK